MPRRGTPVACRSGRVCSLSRWGRAAGHAGRGAPAPGCGPAGGPVTPAWCPRRGRPPRESAAPRRARAAAADGGGLRAGSRGRRAAAAGRRGRAGGHALKGGRRGSPPRRRSAPGAAGGAAAGATPRGHALRGQPPAAGGAGRGGRGGRAGHGHRPRDPGAGPPPPTAGGDRRRPAGAGPPRPRPAHGGGSPRAPLGAARSSCHPRAGSLTPRSFPSSLSVQTGDMGNRRTGTGGDGAPSILFGRRMPSAFPSHVSRLDDVGVGDAVWVAGGHWTIPIRYPSGS